MNTTSNLVPALALAEEYGVPVFPCGADKAPLVERGFHAASCNIEQVAEWWGRWPEALVGVPTGKASKLLVIDVDPEGADWNEANVANLCGPRIHKTRRGEHLLYRMPDIEIRNSAGKIAPGIDVRGEGGYVIWWPAEEFEASGPELDELPEPPQWVIAALTSPTKPIATASGSQISHTIPEGARNSSLASLAGKMRRIGLEPPEIAAALHAANHLRCAIPLDTHEVDTIATSVSKYAPANDANAEPVRIARTPLDWNALNGVTPPVREWAVSHWLGQGHVTLMAGAGGSGKTAVAQALGSCLALRRNYLDEIPVARRVLMWAAEDDHNELWRRQLAIAQWLGVELSAFQQSLFVHSYDAQEVELAGLVDQRHLVAAPMYTELCEQIVDYKSDVVILDNLARLYAGNENDRHQVTSFIAMLTKAAQPTHAAVLLLGHPGKAAGSEFSGSTAWEGAVRARLYLGRTLPDAESNDDAAADDTVRYLSRRKANYSALDWRRLSFRDGVMIPEPIEQGTARTSPVYARAIVTSAVRKLAEMGEHGTASSASPNYLPKLAKNYNLLEQTSEREFAAAMREMRKDGTLAMRPVGKYANRTAKEGLVMADAGAHK
jgi:hypothetical protein